MQGNKRRSNKIKFGVQKQTKLPDGPRGAFLARFAALWNGLRRPSDVASHTASHPEQREPGFRARVEGAIERLKDAQWEVRESEARYRDLLEAQHDVIFRRDADGRLTFVNDSHCRVFGVNRRDVIGHAFAPVVRTGQLPPALAADMGRSQRFALEVETADGPRWFDIEEHHVAGRRARETQAVGRDITDQRRRQTELAEARDAAEQANRAKSRFLAAMSHEIRTPMNGILGMTALLKDTETTAEQKTYVTAVERSARTLLSLIDEILDFSRIEAGRLDLDEMPFSVEECVQAVVELLYPRAKEKGIALAWAIDPDVPRLGLGDEARLRQIVINLVGNAVKFTDTGGVLVTVALDRSSEPLVRGDSRLPIAITVKDTGPGISAEAFTFLFGEFERGDETNRRQHSGTGLGLAISRRLARAMGGDITALSRLGEGSEFRAEVTLKTVGPPRRRPMPDPGRHHVLLAIADGVERAALQLTLEGAHVPAAGAALADAVPVIAAAAANDAPFTIAIVDGGHRPPSDLSALADSVRAAGPDGAATVYVMLDAAPRGSFAEYARAGFDDYLIRPVRPQSLIDRVTTIGPYRQPASEVAAEVSAPAPRGRAKRRILLVEDNDINALLARRMLEKSGCAVVHAKDGQKGLDVLTASLDGHAAALDLVLMDVHMPVLDGLEAARRMKAMTLPPGRTLPPIIALTANAFAEDRVRCLEAGMDGYLAKPFEKDELEALLQRWVHDARRSDAA